MTLLGEDAPDVEDFVAAWLQPVIRAAVERDSDDVLPFCVVARVAGGDDPDCGFDESVVQLDVFGAGPLAASAAAMTVHRRMMLLARELTTVIVTGGVSVSPNRVTTQMKPFRSPYEHDQVVRYTARYGVGLAYVAVA